MASVKLICCVNFCFLILISFSIGFFAPRCTYPLVCTNIESRPFARHARSAVEKAQSVLANATAIQQSMQNLTSAFHENDAKVQATWLELQAAMSKKVSEERMAAQYAQRARETRGVADAAAKAANGSRMQAKRERTFLEDKRRARKNVGAKSARLHDEVLAKKTKANKSADAARHANQKVAGDTKLLNAADQELEDATSKEDSLRQQHKLRLAEFTNATREAKSTRDTADNTTLSFNQAVRKHNATALNLQRMQVAVNTKIADLKQAQDELAYIEKLVPKSGTLSYELSVSLRDARHAVAQANTTVNDFRLELDHVKKALKIRSAHCKYLRMQMDEDKTKAFEAANAMISANQSLTKAQHLLSVASQKRKDAYDVDERLKDQEIQDVDLANTAKRIANLSQQRLIEAISEYNIAVGLSHEAVDEERAAQIKLNHTLAEACQHQADAEQAMSKYNSTEADRSEALVARRAAISDARSARLAIAPLVTTCLALQLNISDIFKKTIAKKNALRSRSSNAVAQLANVGQAIENTLRDDVDLFSETSYADLEKRYWKCKSAPLATWEEKSRQLLEHAQRSLQSSEWEEMFVNWISVLAYASLNAAILDTLVLLTLVLIYVPYRCVLGVFHHCRRKKSESNHLEEPLLEHSVIMPYVNPAEYYNIGTPRSAQKNVAWAQQHSVEPEPCKLNLESPRIAEGPPEVEHPRRELDAELSHEDLHDNREHDSPLTRMTEPGAEPSPEVAHNNRETDITMDEEEKSPKYSKLRHVLEKKKRSGSSCADESSRSSRTSPRKKYSSCSSTEERSPQSDKTLDSPIIRKHPYFTEDLIDQPDKAEGIYIFQPGRLGLHADWRTGLIMGVVPGGQGESNCVRIGWTMVQINDQAYSEPLIDKFIEGRVAYEITFNKATEHLQTTTEAVSKRKNTEETLGLDDTDVPIVSGSECAKDWQADDLVDYYSTSHSRWIPSKILQVEDTGYVIDKKPHAIVQADKLRPRQKQDQRWMCPSCQHENSTGDKFCTKCGTTRQQAVVEQVPEVPAFVESPKPEAVSPSKRTSLVQPSCVCGTIFIKDHWKFCRTCGAKRPEPTVQLETVCACGVVFPADYCKFCRSCGAKRPEPEDDNVNAVVAAISRAIEEKPCDDKVLDSSDSDVNEVDNVVPVASDEPPARRVKTKSGESLQESDSQGASDSDQRGARFFRIGTFMDADSMKQGGASSFELGFSKFDETDNSSPTGEATRFRIDTTAVEDNGQLDRSFESSGTNSFEEGFSKCAEGNGKSPKKAATRFRIDTAAVGDENEQCRRSLMSNGRSSFEASFLKIPEGNAKSPAKSSNKATARFRTDTGTMDPVVQPDKPSSFEDNFSRIEEETEDDLISRASSAARFRIGTCIEPEDEMECRRTRLETLSCVVDREADRDEDADYRDRMEYFNQRVSEAVERGEMLPPSCRPTARRTVAPILVKQPTITISEEAHISEKIMFFSQAGESSGASIERSKCDRSVGQRKTVSGPVNRLRRAETESISLEAAVGEKIGFFNKRSSQNLESGEVSPSSDGNRGFRGSKLNLQSVEGAEVEGTRSAEIANSLNSPTEPLSHRSVNTNATTSTEGSSGVKVRRRHPRGDARNSNSFWRKEDLAQKRTFS